MVQGIGAALRAGDEVRVTGRVPRGWWLQVRVRDGKRIRVARRRTPAGERHLVYRVGHRHGTVILAYVG